MIENDNAQQGYIFHDKVNNKASVFRSKSTVDEKPKGTELIDEKNESTEISYWGDDNMLPQDFQKKIDSNPDLVSSLDWQARALVSGGIKYHIKKKGEVVSEYHPDIEELINVNQCFDYENALNLYRFANAYPRLLVDKKGKIRYFLSTDSQEARSTLMKGSGWIKETWLHADWSLVNDNKDKQIIKLPNITPHFFGVEEAKEAYQKNIKAFCYPQKIGTGKRYYQQPGWYSLVLSNWYDMSMEVPKTKISMLKNQMTIKYHVIIYENYMAWRYSGKWETMKPKEKAKAWDAEFTAIKDQLTGAENAGRTIGTSAYFDDLKKLEYPSIKITPIDDKLKDGMWLEDSAEATIKIYSALNIDPSLAGIIPGKGGSNRSGSDKREAFNAYFALLKPHQNIVLAPYYFAVNFNDWLKKDETVEFWYQRPFMQALNDVSPEARETVMPEKSTTENTTES